mgnify:FL=1
MSLESALALVESVKDYKVLFVGDTIIDEYHYVTQLGRSQKEPIIPLRFENAEVFRGGVEAAANHARSFCARVEVGTFPNAVRKVRFVDKTYLRKLGEVHYEETVKAEDVWLHVADAMVVTDFGHGGINDENVKRICNLDAFVAVSAQTNSSNIGFNLITKYTRADYAVIDEPEARLAAADRYSAISVVAEKLARDRFSKLIITHGPHGAYGWEEGKFIHQPTYTGFVRDTMGAGDAFFAVTAPMAKTGSIEDLLLIGNAAGSLKTQIVGHRAPVTKESLIEYMKAHAPR